MLTEKQQEFRVAVLSGESVYLTGKAGTGKSFIVNEIIKELTQLGRNVVAIAPTGIAANNINGQTIHSMFKLSPYGVLDFEACHYVKMNTRMVLGKIDVCIIDEVSMLRPDVLDAMHYTLIKNGLAGLDKRQLVFVGDLKQLPPIYDDNTKSVLYQTYTGDTFLFAKILKKINLRHIELDEIMRQSDPDFIAALNIVREGGKAEYFKQFVTKEAAGIILAPHNNTVAEYNTAGLKAQPGEEFVFEAEIEGKMKIEDLPFEKTVRVKDGCKIMYLINSRDAPLRNGTIGVFRHRDGNHFIQVNGVEWPLGPAEVTKKQYVYDSKLDKLVLEEIGKVVQYPIKLAYALTIHKAQGLTFDEVTVDLRRPTFQRGQTYVALSRARSPKGLRIII
jgi:ATP-dependent exoDNAse (exonuclease V) alpha subunit